MKIISTDCDGKFISTINCNCGTVFEFEASDVIIKGNYVETYSVYCPTCKKEHQCTEGMTEKDKANVKSYIDSCRSCMKCKYMAVIKEGYSSFTVTNISIHCKMKENPNMPLTGYEDQYEKLSTYAYAEKCCSFKNGVSYEKGVEESDADAFKRWEKSNDRF